MNNNSFQTAALKVFAQLGQLIEEDENITTNKNVISNEIDDKPKPINLLDLSTDILNTIGDIVKKEKEREEREERERAEREDRERGEIENSEQIINGKIIMFRNYWGEYITKPLNTKEDIKNYIFVILIGNFQI